MIYIWSKDVFLESLNNDNDNDNDDNADEDVKDELWMQKSEVRKMK